MWRFLSITFDRPVSDWVIARRADWLTDLMKSVTLLGSTTGIIEVSAIIILIYLFLKRGRISALIAYCVGGAFLSSELLKRLCRRERPPLPWLDTAAGYSFPSGHALVTMALYGYLAYRIWRDHPHSPCRIPLILLITLIPLAVGYSRVYLGVHYPSDVLGGWLLGLSWAGVCAAASKKV